MPSNSDGFPLPTRSDTLARLATVGWDERQVYVGVASLFPVGLAHAPCVDTAMENALTDMGSVPSLFERFTTTRLVDSFLRPAADDQIAGVGIRIRTTLAALARTWPAARSAEDDLVQQVFAVLCEMPPGQRYDPARPGSFDAWLSSVTRNQARRHLHREGRRPDGVGQFPDDPPAPADPPPDEPTGPLPLDRMADAVAAQFGSRAADLFRLRHVEALSPVEIARRLGRQAASVYKAIERLEDRMRTIGPGLLTHPTSC